MQIELKPCLFCGSKAKIVPYDSIRFFENILYRVKCTKCYASNFKLLPTQEQAAEAWNRRANDE